MAAFRNDWEEAARRWSSVRERFPDFSPAFVADAEALLRQGRIDEAGALIEEAVKRFPEDRWVADLQARIAARQGKCDEALRTWTTVRERFPEFVPAIVGMADTLKRGATPRPKKYSVTACSASRLNRCLPSGMPSCPQIADTGRKRSIAGKW